MFGQFKAETDYMCSQKLFEEPHALDKTLYVREALACGMSVEKPYYTKAASTKLPTICCWCADPDVIIGSESGQNRTALSAYIHFLAKLRPLYSKLKILHTFFWSKFAI